jgi:hypothetical protein
VAARSLLYLFPAVARSNGFIFMCRRTSVQRSISRIALAAALLAAILPARAQQRGQRPPDPQAQAAAAILEEIRNNSELMDNLEYLTDMIGPRVTGTEKTKQASQWTLEMFKKYGLSNPHLEGWQINRAWNRGTARARIVTPATHPVTLASAGWSPSTPGFVRGTVVFVNARTEEELQQYKGKLKNAIVLAAEPAPLPPPYEIPRSPLLSAPGGPPAAAANPAAVTNLRRLGQARDAFFKAEGVGVVLRDSVKEHGLVNMTGIGGEEFNIGPVPTAFVSPEGYRLIWRLMKRGPVEMELEITNGFSGGPVEVYNTVAEIPGTEKPDEVVIIGAHLDSWDLGTGATDNGTGSMAVLEAARALQKLSATLKPRRTIRFVLFTGEEEGLVGSKKYVEAHKAELEKISAVLVHDTGTGRVQAIGMQGNYQAREVMDRVTAPLRAVGLLESSLRNSQGTDHASFDPAGVPGFYCIQDPAEYRKTHHTQSDTFDKVWKDDIVQGAQVLAVWAYNVAQLPELMPRKPARPAAAAQ